MKSYTNEFIGAGALGMVVDDYNGDNFDHSGLGFIGGAYIASWTTNQRPDRIARGPGGNARLGAGVETGRPEKLPETDLIVRPRSLNGASQRNYLDLDPNYNDQWGRPLMRMTYRFHRQRPQALGPHHADRRGDRAQHGRPRNRRQPSHRQHLRHQALPDDAQYRRHDHGTDARDSVVNRYLQSWDLHNLFIMGASVFPQNAGYNPTDTVAALTYWSAQAIRSKYLRNPGPMVQA